MKEDNILKYAWQWLGRANLHLYPSTEAEGSPGVQGQSRYIVNPYLKKEKLRYA